MSTLDSTLTSKEEKKSLGSRVVDTIFHKKRAVRTLDYLINIDGYRAYWNDWDIAREMISNALDAEEGDFSKVSISNTDGVLEIRNAGKVLDIRDFYLGYSSQGKTIDKDYIGRFNEGLKLALAVAVRSGYDIKIRFGAYAAKPLPVIRDGIRTLRVCIEKAGGAIEGTSVTIKGMKNVEKMLAEKMLASNDKRILTDVVCGQSSLIKSSRFQPLYGGGVFVGGMYICDNKGYAWGYNFSPSMIKMSEGRNMVDDSQVHRVLEATIQYVNEPSYWESIFSLASSRKKSREESVWPYIYDMREETKKVIGEAWVSVLGHDAVVEDDLAAEVVYRGGRVIKKSQLLERLAQCGILQNGASFIRRFEERTRSIVKFDALSAKEKRIYVIANGIISEYAPGYALEIFEQPERLGINYFGLCDRKSKKISLNLCIMRDSKELVNTLIEEMTHAVYNTDDTSRKHVDSVRLLSTKMLFDRKISDYISELRAVYSNGGESNNSA